MNFARKIRRQKEQRVRKATAARKRRKAILEPLEPRILLDADLTNPVGAAAFDLTLRIDDATQELRLIDNTDPDPASLDQQGCASGIDPKVYRPLPPFPLALPDDPNSTSGRHPPKEIG